MKVRAQQRGMNANQQLQLSRHASYFKNVPYKVEGRASKIKINECSWQNGIKAQ